MKKYYIYPTIIFCISMLFSDPSQGQWKRFIYTDGISSNYIFDVEKDNRDRIWIGTQNGITLIDGTKFKKYGAADGLPAADIIKVIEIKNKIYAATSTKGIYVLGSDDLFLKTSIVKGSSLYTMEKVGDDVFISTNLENVLFDGDNVSFMDRGFPNAKIRDVYTNEEQSWFVSDDKLISKNGGKFTSEKIQFSSTKTKIQSFISDGGVDYFGTNQGLFSRADGGQIKLLKKINVNTMEMTDEEIILLGAKKGLHYLKEGKVKKYAPNLKDEKLINKTAIRDIKYINNNEIWYATFGMGIYLHDLGTFKNFGVSEGMNVSGMVFDMVTWKDLVYVATRNGLFIYSDNKIKKHYTKNDGLPSNIILDLDLDTSGNLFMATSAGLSKLSRGKIVNYSKKDGLPAKLVTAVHVDKSKKGVIWLGSESSGLTRFDKKGFYTFAVQDGLPSNSIRDINQSENGDLVIACYNAGVAGYNGKSFKLFNDGLDDKRVIIITNGPNNTIWAGTESAGIGVLENNKFKMIRDSDGLGHNEIFSLFYDGKDMWAGTFGGGVSCLSDDIWFTMRVTDGLNSNTIGAITKSKSGKIILGGNNGLSIFSRSNTSFDVGFSSIITPKSEISNPISFDTPLSGIVLDRFYVNANPLVYNPSISDIRYRTRVVEKGATEASDWSEIQLSPQISYVPSSVGDYVFQVQAIDNRVLTSNISQIPFSIGRVWYLDPKTAIPFWGGILLLIGFSIVNYINYLKKSKEAKELREAEIARQQAEMEEAREFQQAMLPNEMPITDEYELVGFQQTATEVGGDFFDFMQKEDGRWVAICGDATGHGLTSGNVVSITKTAMSSLVEEAPVPTLDSLNTTLLKMNIGLNRMCLNIANLGKDSIRFSSAGMPPAYYYNAEKGELEEILVGALPLGSLPGAMHMEQEIAFKNSGDILVMMSDGLPEAENDKDEMVGYERTLDRIKSLSTKSAEEIKDGLVELCNTWLSDTAELKDDMTFVIIKKK